MFHSIIYEDLKQRDNAVAVSFLRDYNAFYRRRSLLSLSKGSFTSVTSYFFSVFSCKDSCYQRELRCISGNPTPALWLEDFRNVIADTYIRDHSTLAIHTHGNSQHLISELGDLLGVD